MASLTTRVFYRFRFFENVEYFGRKSEISEINLGVPAEIRIKQPMTTQESSQKLNSGYSPMQIPSGRVTRPETWLTVKRSPYISGGAPIRIFRCKNIHRATLHRGIARRNPGDRVSLHIDDSKLASKRSESIDHMRVLSSSIFEHVKYFCRDSEMSEKSKNSVRNQYIVARNSKICLRSQ